MRRLSDHFAAGRLSVAEFDERSAKVAAAMTRGDLAPIFADLPEPVPPPQQQQSVPAPKPHDRKSDARGALVGLAVIVALVLFFVTHTWLWFLLIPAAAILAGAATQSGHEHRGGRQIERRDWRNERRNQRRDRRRGR